MLSYDTLFIIKKSNQPPNTPGTLMMTNDSNNGKPRRGRLKITQERVVAIVCRTIELKGLEAAQGAFEQMNAFFSTEKGWAETADEVYALFAEKRKEKEQKLREEKLEEQRAAASNLFVLTKATSDAKTIGKAEIDKMDVDVSSPGNNIAKFINLGKDNDE